MAETAPAPLVDIDSIAIDLDREEAGVRRQWRSGVGLWIASSGRSAYQAQARELLRRAREERGDREPTERETLAMLAPAIAKHLLRGWEGLSRGGAPLPYSVAQAEQLLADERYYHLAAFVVAQAADLEAFLGAAAKSAEGD